MTYGTEAVDTLTKTISQCTSLKTQRQKKKTQKYLLIHTSIGSYEDAKMGGFSLFSFLVTFINNTAYKINASDDSSLIFWDNLIIKKYL